MNKVITRFAPSPTGYLHIGNIRTALYSWLYARKNNGKFILRIEDTNFCKYNKKYIDSIFYILEWLGLYWDDKPFYQSERLDLYKYIVNKMLKKNLAYKCYCSSERLNKLRYLCKKNNTKYFYDGYCRNKYINYKDNVPYVVRFKNPKFGNVIFKDVVFGKIKIKNKFLDDIIIQRSNGFPTYNLCVVIDDYYMSISHVIRGEDHLSNTPKQINILNSLNYKNHIYVHLPMILSNDRKKLSKRNLESDIKKYINEGILPEAILNYLFILGWSYKNYELINIYEMKYLFNFYNLNKSSCIFNYKKLIWFNKYYISNINFNKLIYYIKYFFLKKNININNIYKFNEIISFYSKRCYKLSDMSDFCLIFINRSYLINKKEILKYVNKYSYKIINYFFFRYLKLKNIDLININYIINILLKKFFFLKKNKIFYILRYFLTGKSFTPNLSIIIYFLGNNEIKYRLNYIIKNFFIDFIKN